ncbi:MAG: serine/threonine protein kinase [Planctomycetes bacterium]|nr:serine/threonine protein kinase [Planctomycetota bacterium]
MSECLTSEQIRRYVAGQCSDREIEKIKAHLVECAICRGKVGADGADTSAERTPNGSAGREEDFQTKSMPDASVFQTRGDDTATSLETMTDGYKILGVLPRGGQAVVYKAIQKATKRTVAVKVLLQGEHASKRARYRFEQEIELVARLKHPNIVTIFDSGITEEQYYYAMEFIKGKPLDEYIDEEKLSLRKTMELFGKVASAIAYAHQHGIIHRDLKPGNIMVDEQGEPHVLDFGLAKLVDGFEQTYEKTVMTTIAGHVLGTLAFMSPEQATADPDAVDVRTDVYSMGVILYKVLTGEFPYPIGGPMFEILQNIKQYDPVRPLKLVPGFNSEIEAIVLRALAKEPQRRYQSAAELYNDIQCWLTGRPIVARSDSSLYVLQKLIVRNRAASAVVGLLIVIITAFAFTNLYLYDWARDGWETTEEQKIKLQEELDLTKKQGLWFSFKILLDGWRQDEIGPGQSMAILKQDERFNAAQIFLLEASPIEEKVAAFKNKLGASGLWFAEYITGEHYLKDGKESESLDAFENSLRAIGELNPDQPKPEEWIVNQINSRLIQLRD